MLSSIQRLRGLACLMVFCQHICLINPMKFIKDLIPPIFHYGSGGVHLFFVISGFVIALSLKDKLEICCKSDNFGERLKSSCGVLKIFFTKRIFRLCPVLLVALLLFIGFHLFITNDSRSIAIAIKTIFDVISTSYADCVINNVYIEKVHLGGLGPWWTLSVEILFYILFPIVFLLLKDHSQRLKFTLVGGMISWLFIRWIMFNVLKFNSDLDIIYYSSFANMDGLLLGSFLGLIYNIKDIESTAKDSNSVYNLMVLFCIIGIWCCPSLGAVKDEVRWANTAVFFSVILVALAIRNVNILNFMGIGRFLEFLGNRSYSFYVYQLIIASSLNWMVSSGFWDMDCNVDFKLAMIFMISLCFITEVSYRFIEIPFRKIGMSKILN